MPEQTNPASGVESFRKPWGFGTGSISSELQAAAVQIAADSRIPGSDVSTLLTAFLRGVTYCIPCGEDICGTQDWYRLRSMLFDASKNS